MVFLSITMMIDISFRNATDDGMVPGAPKIFGLFLSH